MDFTLLVNAPLFNKLTLEEIRNIFKETPYQVRKYNAGSMIAHSGEEIKSFIMVISGVVKGEMVDYSGRVIKIEDMPAPHALASAFIFGRKKMCPVNVVATTEASLLIINKTEFLRLLTKDERILINFLDMTSDRS